MINFDVCNHVENGTGPVARNIHSICMTYFSVIDISRENYYNSGNTTEKNTIPS